MIKMHSGLEIADKEEVCGGILQVRKFYAREITHFCRKSLVRKRTLREIAGEHSFCAGIVDRQAF